LVKQQIRKKICCFLSGSIMGTKNGLVATNLKNFCCSLLDSFVSGSPIIQNGKIIGAVTHVLVNDSTKGYGIFIENMLEHSDE
jgi:hypothetical protein